MMSSGPGFVPPTVAQPATNVSDNRIRFNKSYAFTLTGILRFFLIVYYTISNLNKKFK